MKELRNYKNPVIKTDIPGPKSKMLLELDKKYVPKAIYNIVPSFIKRAEGAVIEDCDGNIFIDFGAGISVVNIGYSNPEVIEAVKKQVEKYFHTAFNIMKYESYVNVAKKLAEISPGDYKKKTIFVNSGAEAIENAIKVARGYMNKSDIISFEGAFHGRTLLTASLNGRIDPFGLGFGPFAPGIHKIPFASCYRCVYGLKKENCNFRCAERLNEILSTLTNPRNVAAVILEPIQGTGGFIVPPDEFIFRIKKICERNNILLIADEVQSGFCRSGKMFASEYWNVVPDIIATAKSIAGGLPLGAVIAKAEIMDSIQASGLGGTFGGNPLSCVAAEKVIEIMERDNFAEKSNSIGSIVLSRFEKMKEKYSIIGDIRGRGSMIGMELVKDRITKEPAANEVKQILKEAYENGVILLSSGPYKNIIRISPPLVITEEQLNSGLEIIEKIFCKIF
ncbi:MAG TPA: aspartate aminotransferase family protein [Candidatus Atribacteria bacterium]|nr:aspartate aminotransferase family protein [Candidatus Atribacteria bacterium]